ncbi:MAG TPA: hypothetical protein VEJ16_12240 [Alphaproteobacteria bacterium]|nr:hypothetical protein [Alphaproteobacteria bacterium]
MTILQTKVAARKGLPLADFDSNLIVFCQSRNDDTMWVCDTREIAAHRHCRVLA